MSGSPPGRRGPRFPVAALPLPAARALRRALGAADAGDPEALRAGLAEAVDADPDGATTRLLVARTRLATGAFDEGLADLEAAARMAPDPAYPRRMRLAWLIRLHYLEEARAELETHLAGPRDPALLETASLLLARTGAPARALELIRERLAQEGLPEAKRTGLHLHAARTAAAAGDTEAVADLLAAHLRSGTGDWSAARELHLEQGRPDRLAALAAAHPEVPAAQAIAAELALFRGDLDEAGRLARDTLARAPETTLAQLVDAAVAVRRGADDAGTRLDAVIAAAPDWPEAWLWRAEHRRLLGDLAGAADDIFEAKNRRPDYLAAKARHALVHLAGERPGGSRPAATSGSPISSPPRASR